MRLPALALLLLASGTAAAERALHFSIVESWAMPLIRIENGKATGGIIHDMILSLARQVGREADLQVMPRNRVQRAMEEGLVDVRCYLSPRWISQPGANYRWSVPLFMQRDLLVGTSAQDKPVEPESLEPQIIGVVLGYRYKRLDPLFERGTLQRDDARTQELVLNKLLAGRYRYAISSQFSLDWFNRRLAPAEQLRSVAQLAEEPIACLVHDTPDVPAQALLDTLQRMKASGEIEAIIARYR
ncbi:MAG: transporter substrate-binding domain-containing protein [Pseudomonadota bacterium]